MPYSKVPNAFSSDSQEQQTKRLSSVCKNYHPQIPLQNDCSLRLLTCRDSTIKIS